MTAVLDGPPLCDLRNVSTVTQPYRVFTDLYVGEWPGLAIFMDAIRLVFSGNGNAQRVVATWTSAPGDYAAFRWVAVRDFLWCPNTSLPGVVSSGFGTLGQGGIVVPNRAPFLTLEIDNAGGVDTAILHRFACWGTTRESGSFAPEDPLAGQTSWDTLVDISQLTVGAGATHRQAFNFWYSGPAHVWETGSTGVFTIFALRNDRTLAYIDQYDASVRTRAAIWIPPRPCLVDVTNTDGVAHDYWISIMPDW